MLSPHHLLAEPFCRGNVAFCREHKFNCLARLIDRALQILIRLSDFDVGLIHWERRTPHLQMLTDAFIDLRRLMLNESETRSNDPGRVHAPSSSPRHHDKRAGSGNTI